MSIVMGLFLFVRGMLTDRARLAAENLALGHQVVVLKQRNLRPKLQRWGRIFWVCV